MFIRTSTTVKSRCGIPVLGVLSLDRRGTPDFPPITGYQNRSKHWLDNCLGGGLINSVDWEPLIIIPLGPEHGENPPAKDAVPRVRSTRSTPRLEKAFACETQRFPKF